MLELSLCGAMMSLLTRLSQVNLQWFHGDLAALIALNQTCFKASPCTVLTPTLLS